MGESPLVGWILTAKMRQGRDFKWSDKGDSHMIRSACLYSSVDGEV